MPHTTEISSVDSLVLHQLGFNELLSNLKRFLFSSQAILKLDEFVFFDQDDEINTIYDQVEGAITLFEEKNNLPAGDIFDIRKRLSRLEKHGVLSAEGLIEISITVRTIDHIAQFLRKHKTLASRFAEMAIPIVELRDLWETILSSFDADGELADNASSELYDLRRKNARIKKDLKIQMKRLMDSPHISKHLQDRFLTEREGRFVLPMRSDSAGSIDGIVLGSSSSGSTLFVEPRQMVDRNNDLKVSNMAIAREEAKILGELSTMVYQDRHIIAENLGIIVEIDLIQARAKLAKALNATRPILSKGFLDLKEARHPILTLKEAAVVPHNITLSPYNALIISGPNAGGKTVSLKTVGLCALMVRAALFIPCKEESSIPIYNTIFSEIGDSQSIEQNLSTFTAHMNRLILCINHLANDLQKSKSLVLIDEIVTGTDPGEGAALAQALLENIVQNATTTLITTHYEKLKMLPTSNDAFKNASVGFDLEHIQPSFELHLGSPGTSFALEVAKRLGLNLNIYDRALNIRESSENELSELLVELSNQRNDLILEKKASKERQRSADAKEKKYQQKLKELNEKGEALLDKMYLQGLRELRQTRKEIEHIGKKLKKETIDKKRLKELDRSLSRSAKTLLSHEKKKKAPETFAIDELKLGMNVYIPRLGGIAEIIELPNRGKLNVRFKSIRTLVSVDELRAIKDAPKETRQNSKTTKSPKQVAQPNDQGKRSIDNTLELIGERVDDALRKVDNYLDESLLHGKDTIYLLHGRGTGILRSAIREHLATHPSVADFGDASHEAGGDALTRVNLK